MKRLNSKLVKFLSGMALTVVAGQSMAGAILVLDDSTVAGINDVLVMDDTAAGVVTPFGTTTHADSNAVAGVVTFSGTTGGIFDVNVTTGISKPVIGPRKIDLNSVNVNSSGAGTLTLGFSDIDFVTPTSGASHNFVSHIGGTTNGEVTALWAVDDSNSYFATSGAVGTQGPFSGGAFSATDTISTVVSTPFSISQIVVIDHSTGGSITSFDMEVSEVPEPAVLGLLGFGLLGVGMAKRRRQSA